MHKPLLPVAILLTLSACQSGKAGPRRLQALTYSLEQANNRATRENEYLWKTIQNEVAGGRFGQLTPNSAVAQLLAHSDTIQLVMKQWRAHLFNCREQLSALAISSPHASLGPETYKETTQLLQQMAAYRVTLLAQDSQLVLPRLLPPRMTADTTAAAMADFYFRNATPAEAMAALAQLEATMLADEAAALLGQNMRLACGGNIIFDSTHAQALTDTSAVVAGTEYRASFFLAAVLKPAGLTMSANGQPVTVRPGGTGQVRFIADPRLLGNKQEVTAYWNGLIRVKSGYTHSGDTTYKVRVPYRIVRSK
jgi:hypothetical protein